MPASPHSDIHVTEKNQEFLALVESLRGGRVLLINPPETDTLDAEQMDLISCVEPFGLLRMGTWFRGQGYEVDCLDCLRDPLLRGPLHRHVRKELPCGAPSEGRTKKIYQFGLTSAEIEQRLSEFPKPDIIAITSIFTWHLDVMTELVASCKEIYPDATVAIGGNLPTILPSLSAATGADFVFVGDLQEARFMPTAVDLLPTLPNGDYIRMIKGCPYNCSYCVTSFLNSGRVLARPPEEVFAEMQEKNKNFGISNFVFYDDFVLYKQSKFFDPLMALVARERPDFRLEFPLGFSAHVLTYEFVARLKEARVEVVTLALETISKERNKAMNRPHQLQQFMRAVAILRAHGYSGRGIRVFFLIGLPNQTLDEILKGILFILHLKAMPSLTAFTLTPGTDDMDTYREQVAHLPLDALAPNLWSFANEEMTSRDLDMTYHFFYEKSYPLERIAGSKTNNPVILRMQEILREKGHLPENW